MKHHMKKLTAALMAVAMVLSLSVTAFATGVNVSNGDNTNTVTTEGGLPVDITTVVLPTGLNNAFQMIFDSHGMIAETNAIHYATENHGGKVTDIDDSRLFFKKYTPTIIDKPFVLAVAEGTGDTDLPAGETVVQYVKATTIGKIYAKDVGGDNFKWVKVSGSAVADVEDADFGAGNAYAKIASLKKLDPTSGYGLDAIAKLNQDDPNLYLKKGAAVLTSEQATAAGAAGLAGTWEYTFVSAYGDTNTAANVGYVHFTKDGTADKFFANLGTGTTAPDAWTGAASTGLSSFTDDAPETAQTIDGAKMTVSSNDFYRQRQTAFEVALKKTSTEVKVINKTNAALGVTMSAELTNLPGGDGTKPDGAQTYVYAKDYDATTDKFYDDVATATTRNVIQGGNDGVPVFYLALKDGTDTEVMTYGSGKGTVSLLTSIAGQPDFFHKDWDTTLNNGNGGYAYTLSDRTTRESAFASKTFYFEGAIDAHNNVWNSLASPPNLKVTWSIKTIAPLTAPTITKPATVSTKSATTFQITNTTDKLVLTGIKQGNTEIATASLNITTADDTGTTAVTVAKGVITGTQDLVFTFKHPTETYRTKEVTVLYAA